MVKKRISTHNIGSFYSFVANFSLSSSYIFILYNMKIGQVLPLVTKENYFQISYISFWIALVAAFSRNPLFLYVYFVIQWCVSVGGIVLATNGLTDIFQLQMQHVIRYIIPIAVLYWETSKQFYMHYHYNQYYIIFGFVFVYSAFLWIHNKKTLYDVYGNTFTTVILATLTTALLWN